MNRKELGIIGEKLAKDFLKKRGYRIHKTNFSCRVGEIDIIARKNDCLVFVEVRTKASIDFGSPEESMTLAKREKIVAVALSYLNKYQNQSSKKWRIDFIGLELDHNGKATRIEHIENAVESKAHRLPRKFTGLS